MWYVIWRRALFCLVKTHYNQMTTVVLFVLVSQPSSKNDFICILLLMLSLIYITMQLWHDQTRISRTSLFGQMKILCHPNQLRMKTEEWIILLVKKVQSQEIVRVCNGSPLARLNLLLEAMPLLCLMAILYIVRNCESVWVNRLSFWRWNLQAWRHLASRSGPLWSSQLCSMQM